MTTEIKANPLSDYVRITGTETPPELLSALLQKGIDSNLWQPNDIQVALERFVKDCNVPGITVIPLERSGFIYNPNNREIKTPTGLAAQLTPAEHLIFYQLMANMGRLIRYQQLAQHLTDLTNMDGSLKNLIKVHIHNIRLKIGDEHLKSHQPPRFRYIAAIRPDGYMFDPLLD